MLGFEAPAGITSGFGVHRFEAIGVEGLEAPSDVGVLFDRCCSGVIKLICLSHSS